ncbi:MAG: bifunctional [glutamate--ammonia ligase]-adenylyl-L-tyrosine phosphorylase/[glutamate--ammonia-ligase] adenylyltransferase [Gammaproteobacteria bacterium]|nr:bifunctional [glutamate--ammonia ligase]-adenylyl-L-tyrosine phosphorylase/[glutamate--ammonia-ligase] adenylyltransferase [Gammaproteobacteria bacterium]
MAARVGLSPAWAAFKATRRQKLVAFETRVMLPQSLPGADLPPALAESVAIAWQRFRSACGTTSASLPPATLTELARVFAMSPFVAEYAITRPDSFLDLLTSGDLDRGADPTAIADQIAAAALPGSPLEHAAAALRRLRYRELVRIAWRDLTRRATLRDTVTDLSTFADACIRQASVWAERDLHTRFGTPRDASGGEQHLIVLAMGKLGGRELNFSSDVDLIFLYHSSGMTDGRKEISNQEFFDRCSRRVIALLNDVTEDGFVFRVDTRLRPFGDSGAPSVSFSALEQYLVVHGRDWERYALIKGRALTGSDHDTAALRALCRPFVYRRYLDFGAFAAVRDMKSLIDREVRQQDLAADIKRGPGGIREIEFIAQTFQLIRGGREPRLRVRPLLATLNRLTEARVLQAAESDRLSDAYKFLRDTEHRLQEMYDRQTQRLPDSALDQTRLAFAMGFPDWPAFLDTLDHHRDAVQRLFDSLLHGTTGSDAPEQPLAGVWSDPAAAEAVDRLRAHGYQDPAPVIALLLQLRAAPVLSRLSRDGLGRLDALMPVLLRELGMCTTPAATLVRINTLLLAIAQRSVSLALLAEHPQALHRLVELFTASPWIANQIARHPLLLDELLDARTLYSPLTEQELPVELDRLLARHSADDLEENMDTLRNFRQQQMLRVAASDILDRFPIAEVSNRLTYIAETSIRAALRLALHDLTARHGEPQCVDQGMKRTAHFAILGYGKLGGLELSYSSDLDLVFIHDSRGEQQQTSGPKVLDNAVFFRRLAQRLIHLLATPTSAGVAYVVDLRLRPDGDSGLVAPSVEAFAEYQRHAAWTWEHQALIRARCIAGEAELCRTFERVRAETLCLQRDPVDLAAQIVSMRDRMRAELDDSGMFDLKQGLGGITDIEFMVQYGILRWAHVQPRLVEYTDNLRLLELLERHGLWPVPMCRQLHDAYFAYRAEVHRLALLEQPAVVSSDSYPEHRRQVKTWWRQLFS